jgi:cation:H+ antiporter
VAYSADLVAFILGAVVSLFTSWLLVLRLERVGERLGFSEALLGMVAALAADAPEITSAVTALSHRQQAIGAGVVIGSNVFNLAALLGLGALVAGRIGLHRKVIVLGGAVAMWVAVVCLLSVEGVLNAVTGLVLVLLALVPYGVVLSTHRTGFGRIRLGERSASWLAQAIDEEELELVVAIRPKRGSAKDALVAVAALIVVVVASIAMERGASSLGDRYSISGIVVGGLVLAAVTSLPNAVAAIYLAGKGRGAAAFSTALNSNGLNVLAGLLIPSAFISLARPSAQTTTVAGFYLGMTGLVLVLAYADRGLRRSAGALVIGGYLVFLATLLAIS